MTPALHDHSRAAPRWIADRHGTVRMIDEISGTYNCVGEMVSDKHGRPLPAKRVDDPHNRSEAEVLKSVNHLLEADRELDFVAICFCAALVISGALLAAAFFLLRN